MPQHAGLGAYLPIMENQAENTTDNDIGTGFVGFRGLHALAFSPPAAGSP